MFLLRTCEEGVFQNRSRPCLLGQIGRCSAPCVGNISAEDYARDVKRAKRFLEGNSSEILNELQSQMAKEASELRFEAAAATRDKIASLSTVLEGQTVETTGGDTDADILAVYIKSGAACVNLAMVAGTSVTGRSSRHSRAAPRRRIQEKCSKPLCRITMRIFPCRRL